ENQLKAIRSFISQRVDYIVFSPVVETVWETVLQEAKEAGIPVIVMDRSVNVADQSLYTTHVGSDSVEEGRQAGRWLEKDLAKQEKNNEDINIVVLKGTEGSSAQIGRTMGFASVAGEHGNWHILEQQYGDFTIYKGKEVMEEFLRRYDDIDVVISQNDDMTIGAIEAIKEDGRTVGVNGEITIISFDAVHDALEMVAEGTINVDIECNPNQGEYISDVISLLEAGQEVEKRYYVEEDVFTIENVTKEVLDERSY
ncbi:MAG: ABC transporter substrate-binding protein, partial [Lachnospiraceae bacterium]|nr:ABC transporter substrate-binding protein [Lachnospiraceae bacterium]